VNKKQLQLTLTGVIAATAIGIITLTPGKGVNVNGQKYRVKQYEDQTIVTKNNYSVRTEMIDINNNDTLDSYMIKTYNSLNIMPHSISGKDIPESVQKEYRQVMNVYRHKYSN
jgi:acyl-coenzyme A synthetase/AMP-(fatty) acid ligase